MNPVAHQMLINTEAWEIRKRVALFCSLVKLAPNLPTTTTFPEIL